MLYISDRDDDGKNLWEKTWIYTLITKKAI